MHKNKFNSLTILIPAFNELKNFEKFLKDLSKRFNVLVVDDGSIDETPTILLDYSSRDSRLRVLSSGGGGVVDACRSAASE